MAVDEQTIDLSTIPFGDTTLSFKIYNRIAKSILLNCVDTECYCTSYDVAWQEISSLDAAALVIRFSPDQAGYFLKVVTVYFKKETRSLVLCFKGRLLSDDAR